MSSRVHLIVNVVSACVAVGALGLASHSYLRIQGVDPSSEAAVRYAKVTEAKVAVTELAWGIALCAERTGKLPPSSAQVPSDAWLVRARMYQSRLDDWNDVAFKCADFHLARPQRFQYRWRLTEATGEGQVEAVADFDNDGGVDHEVRLRVRCTASQGQLRCRPDPMPTAPTPLPLTP